jgi:hypothetical protein
MAYIDNTPHHLDRETEDENRGYQKPDSTSPRTKEQSTDDEEWETVSDSGSEYSHPDNLHPEQLEELKHIMLDPADVEAVKQDHFQNWGQRSKLPLGDPSKYNYVCQGPCVQCYKIFMGQDTVAALTSDVGLQEVRSFTCLSGSAFNGCFLCQKMHESIPILLFDGPGISRHYRVVQNHWERLWHRAGKPFSSGLAMKTGLDLIRSSKGCRGCYERLLARMKGKLNLISNEIRFILRLGIDQKTQESVIKIKIDPLSMIESRRRARNIQTAIVFISATCGKFSATART